MGMTSYKSKFTVLIDFFGVLCILTSLSCCMGRNDNKFTKSTELINHTSKYDSCSKTEKMNNLFSKLINIPELQQYINIQKEPWLNQKNLVIIDFENYTDSLVLNKFGEKVLIFTESGLVGKNIKAYIHIDSLDVSENTARMKFNYSIQGVIGYVEFSDSLNCYWSLEKLRLIEK